MHEVVTFGNLKFVNRCIFDVIVVAFHHPHRVVVVFLELKFDTKDDTTSLSLSPVAQFISNLHSARVQRSYRCEGRAERVRATSREVLFLMTMRVLSSEKGDVASFPHVVVLLLFELEWGLNGDVVGVAGDGAGAAALGL